MNEEGPEARAATLALEHYSVWNVEHLSTHHTIGSIWLVEH